MKRYDNPDKTLWSALTERVTADDAVIESRVLAILERVRTQGDKALVELSLEIDKVDLSLGIEVNADEIAQAGECVSEQLKQAIEQAYENIYAFHKVQEFKSHFMLSLIYDHTRGIFYDGCYRRGSGWATVRHSGTSPLEEGNDLYG